MNEAEHFERILEELAGLIGDLGDLATHMVLIGGQVLALESKSAGGDGSIRMMTPTGIELERGFSLEPDLLFDVEAAGFQADRLPEILKERGYQRTRGYRWGRDIGDYRVEIDLFVPPETEPSFQPTGMTHLAGGSRVAAVSRRLQIELHSGRVLQVSVPDPVGFMETKVEAMNVRNEAKDAFDLYAYVHQQSADEIRAALDGAGSEGTRLRSRLKAHFGEPSARGIRDVLTYAGSLDQAVKELLTAAIIDLFDEL